MNELLKTLTFVAVALVLTGAAVRQHARSDQESAEFNDQGQAFFPDFKDPLACTDLEVVDFEPSTATATRFRVMFKDKQVGDPLPLQLSGRREGPAVEDGRRASWT